MDNELNRTHTSNPTSIEIEIWKNVIDGKTSALGDLYDLYIDDLISYGIKVSGDKDHTMDCIHDLFVDLYKYKKKLSKTKNVKFYLFLSLKRKINKKYHKKEVLLNQEVAHTDMYLKDNYAKSNEERIIIDETQKETSLKLSFALDKLTSKQKKGISLRFQEEKSYEEIAQILGVSVASARTIIYRAVKSLREYSLPLFLVLNYCFL